MTNKLTSLTPTIFFGHGSPMNAIEENEFTNKWKNIGQTIEKPKAILAISAHWQTNGSKITGNKIQKTIHDFYGFPQELFNVEYKVNGDETLAARIAKLTNAEIDNGWGLDHGVWSVLVHAFPQADIPTFQLSLDRNKNLQEHFELAKKLKSLREENILIMASGNIVHNLALLNWKPNEPAFDFANSFNDAIKKAIIENDIETILNYQKLPGAKESVPSDEHFIPLIYILALKNADEKIEIFNDKITMGSISMLSVKIG